MTRAALPIAAPASPSFLATVAGPLGELHVFGEERVGAAHLGAGVVPFDGERVAAFLGRPEAAGQHGDALRDGDDFDDAAHLHGSGRIEGPHLGPEPGRMRHDAGQHVGELDVERIDGAAVNLLARVDLGELLADIAPAARVFRLRRARQRDAAGALGELPERGAAPRGVAGDAVLDRDLVGLDAPRLRRGGDEAGARFGSGAAQLVPGIGHGGRAARPLRHAAPFVVAVELEVRWRRFHPDLGVVRVELIGDDGGDARVRTLPELDVLADDRHRVVGCDAQESVRRRRRLWGGALREGGHRPDRPAETDDKAGACGACALQEAAAAGSKGMCHGSGLHAAGCIVDGGADALIGGAAADIAVHGEVDVGVARLPHLG